MFDGAVLRGQYTSIGVQGAQMANVTLASNAQVCGVTGTPASLPAGYIISGDRCFVPAPAPVYEVSELAAPVDGGGVLNVAKAGSTIPFKFSVTKDGVPLTTLTTATASAPSLDCVSGAATDIIESYTTAPGGTLVNNRDGSYQYNYKTAKSWAGCRTLRLDLGDGITVSAQFRFR